MPDTTETDVEKQLNALMSRYGDSRASRELQEDLRQSVNSMLVAGIPHELIAFSVAQHATGFVTAMKMVGTCRPELADLLAQDFTDTVHRAFPGTTQLGNKQ